MRPDEFWELCPFEFDALLREWHWKAEREQTEARALAWETAQLVAVGVNNPKKFPTDLQKYLNPDGVTRLSPEEAEEHRASFEAMKAASDRVPVRPGT